MLEKQIASLNKKIIFQSIICVVLLSFFVWRGVNSYSELSAYSYMLRTTQQEINNIEQKIKYASDYQGASSIVYQSYSKELSNDTKMCDSLANIQTEYNQLANNFRIKNSPSVEISSDSISEDFHGHKNVFIFSNEFVLKFSSQGFRHAMSFIKSAYQMLPPGTMLEEIEITDNTAQGLHQLNSGAIISQSIDSKVRIKVREVRAKKA